MSAMMIEKLSPQLTQHSHLAAIQIVNLGRTLTELMRLKMTVIFVNQVEYRKDYKHIV